jgi:hypothetical protein
MHTHRRRSGFGSVVVSVVVVLAFVALAAAPAGAATDKQTARKGVIVASDLPSTWTSTPDESNDAELDKVAAGIPDCEDYLAVRKITKRTPNVDSRDFSLGDQDLSNEVWVFGSTFSAKRVLTDMGAPTIDDCFTAVFRKAVEADIAADPRSAAQVRSVRVQVTQSSDVPDVGNDVVGYEGGVEVTLVNGTVQTLLVGNLLVRVGRAILSYSLSAPTTSSGYRTAFDSALAATVARMKKALR